MKILITGGSGLLGQYLNIELNKNHSILTLFNQNVGNTALFNSLKIDLTDFTAIKKIINDFHPDIIIHTAAITSVDQAASMPKNGLEKINIKVPEFIAQLCSENKSKLIFTSTDLVYDGSEMGKKGEEYKLNPVSHYAESKLHAEECIQKYADEYLILRTSLMFGFALNHSRNHFTDTISALRQSKTVTLFDDQFRSQLSLKEASKIISELVHFVNKKEIVNFGGNERISRYVLIKKYSEYAGLNSDLIKPTKLRDSKIQAKVFDVSMHITKLESLLNELNPRFHVASINQMFNQL